MKKVLILVALAGLALLGFKTGGFWLFKNEPLDFSGQKMVMINDNGFQFLAHAKAKTVGGLFEQEGIELGQKDIVFPSQEEVIMPRMEISIDRALPVKIEVDGGEIEHFTFKRTVGEVLGEAGVTLSHLDRTDPEKSSGIEKDMAIVVTRIEVEEVTETEPIEFDTIEKEDDDLKWRKKKIEQEGVEGKKEVTYKITYKNGKQVSKEKLSAKVLEEPTDQIVRIGTKIEVGKTKVGVASWYAYTGTMACASRMFPRGTWLRVTSRENGKQVFVQVNDYGPQRGTGKMIDLDKVAFQKLAPLGKGVIEVKVEEILD